MLLLAAPEAVGGEVAPNLSHLLRRVLVRCSWHTRMLNPLLEKVPPPAETEIQRVAQRN